MMTVSEEQALSLVLSKLDALDKRVVRIESKLSQFMEEQGIKVGALRPEFRDGTITLPSLACTMRAVASVIPKNWPLDEEILVYHDGEHVLTVFREEG